MKSKIVALSKNEEFRSLLKKKKISNKFVTIFFGHLIKKDNKKLNISFVTKRKIGNAVKRNRIKRIIRSIVIKNINFMPSTLELEIIPKKHLEKKKYTDLEKDYVDSIKNLVI